MNKEKIGIDSAEVRRGDSEEESWWEWLIAPSFLALVLVYTIMSLAEAIARKITGR